MKLRTSKSSAYTLVEIMIAVSLIGLLATIGLPNYLRAASISKKNQCISNLRQLDSAMQQFVLENKRAASSQVTLEDCTPYLKNSVLCPAGGTTIADSYSVTDGQSVPTCIATGGGAANGHVMGQ
jgi:prepilin-type N-terminal cleavage/methylation domain-containing protein